MDSENDNDQPNSSSASASSSSSNNSSSSNLLGHLPMLPFMRSTDDDEQEADGEADGNDDDLNEEPMPLQPPVTVAMATAAQPASASVQQPTLAPITTTTSSSSSAITTAAATTTAASTSAGREEPMQQHQASPAPQAQSIQQPASSIESASSSSSATLQQQLAAGQSQQERGEQQLTAQINRNDIADTIDASAVIVQPLEANAEHQQHPHLYPQEAANSGEEVEVEQRQNDIHLDDNDNNDFDVDLNLRNDDALATNQQQQQEPQQQQSIPLDTSASGSAGPSSSGQQQQQQQTPQPPTTLPLLLQQQQQQPQQTEESKHLPSYDHHYHNPREFHLHAHPYQHPCVYPYGYRSSSPTHNQQQQQQSNGATLNSSNNNIMFGTSMSSDRNHGSSTSGGLGGGGIASSPNNQVVDRLKLLYPNVNENETPLPRCWSPHDKCLSIGLSQNNLRVHFKGVGKQSNDAASVRTAHPIPPACGIYYFEVKIISKGKNGYMGIGLTAQQFRMNRLPGWDKQSYGYHGDDGNSFSSSGHGQSYGPTFTTGDIIGCCVNFVDNTCFYTKNGIDLGIAFRDLPTKLYPTVGLQTPGEEVDANFGQEPFKFDQIEDMMKQMRGEIKAAIYDFPLRAEQGDPTTLLQKMVNSYLVHNGYSQTAEAFARQKTGQSQREDITSIRNRQKILKLVMSGKMGQAIEQTMRMYPGLLENNKNLWFMLKCRQFIEMINGSDIEYCPSSSTANKTTNTITTQTSAPNQTSVIQSTKLYQNGNGGANNSSNGSGTTDASTSTTTTTASLAVVDATADTTNTTTNNSCSTTQTAAIDTINIAQNLSHITVINTDNDIKTHSNLVEHCSTSNDSPTTISKSNNDNDYLNDVEMENNGHTTNGNVCKNGNTNNFNDSIDADEDMDVDVLPSVRKYSHGIERILEFGKDLSQMGQQLEKENKMTDEERQMLEDAFSLIAYSNPWASPLGWQLCPTKRETVCRALNSAILESMNFSKWPPLEYCVAHANELLKVMAQASIGACAFVNIADVFPKN
ncbi:ran-binding protein 9 isoform X2 [Lucilia sericata]|uniref:ran-binding protein 9 isoform X2 n=1 Tax=Lucilia sericata TaxID=13632 RepID=UPI0018A7FF7C|nr:ran-binding protein 9 isoform X2 [Lucilia sericata]